MIETRKALQEEAVRKGVTVEELIKARNEVQRAAEQVQRAAEQAVNDAVNITEA